MCYKSEETCEEPLKFSYLSPLSPVVMSSPAPATQLCFLHVSPENNLSVCFRKSSGSRRDKAEREASWQWLPSREAPGPCGCV